MNFYILGKYFIFLDDSKNSFVYSERAHWIQLEKQLGICKYMVRCGKLCKSLKNWKRVFGLYSDDIIYILPIDPLDDIWFF